MGFSVCRRMMWAESSDHQPTICLYRIYFYWGMIDVKHDISFRYIWYIFVILLTCLIIERGGLDSGFEFRLDYLGQITLLSLYCPQASAFSFTRGAFWLWKLHDPVLVLSLHGDFFPPETSPDPFSRWISWWQLLSCDYFNETSFAPENFGETSEISHPSLPPGPAHFSFKQTLPTWTWSCCSSYFSPRPQPASFSLTLLPHLSCSFFFFK